MYHNFLKTLFRKSACSLFACLKLTISYLYAWEELLSERHEFSTVSDFALLSF